jgi:hypothetical protein
VHRAWQADHLPLMPNGVSGIPGNALFRNEPFPDDDALVATMAPFDLAAQGLLDTWGHDPTPLLVANGADDPYVPQDDIIVFDNRSHTLTRVISGATHCAPEAMPTLMLVTTPPRRWAPRVGAPWDGTRSRRGGCPTCTPRSTRPAGCSPHWRTSKPGTRCWSCAPTRSPMASRSSRWRRRVIAHDLVLSDHDPTTGPAGPDG